jgi:hypothetical protein
MNTQKFINLIDKSNDCHNWKGAKNDSGYGVAKVDGKFWYAHRLSFKINNGELVDGMEIDHLCRNRVCCNPKHLEQVTKSENIKREIRPNKKNCKCGREYDYITDKYKRCKVCANKSSIKHKLKLQNVKRSNSIPT